MTITCIIPLFNERDRILKVLAEVVKIKDIDQIVLVDDGSTDGSANQIKEHFPSLTIIQNKKNLGKADAVRVGLNEAKGMYILLLDADLQNLHHNEVEEAITAIKSSVDIDMIIFKRIHAPFRVRALRGAVLTSGQRLLRKEELLQVLSLYKPKGYEIELAINQYMLDRHKKVYWMPISILNTKSTDKLGFYKGIKKIITMHIQMIHYSGFLNALKQFLFFCKEEYRTT